MGVLKCWGYNGNGQVGDGTKINRTSPVIIEMGTSYIKISVGDNRTCGVTESFDLKCWGRGWDGYLGDGAGLDRNAPVVVDSGSRYSQVSVNNDHTCAITKAGVIKCWGDNRDGQLDDGTSINRTTPVIIDGGTKYSQIATGGNYDAHTCSITTLGVLKCWGQNQEGQLGDARRSWEYPWPVIP